jgi:hypothetical protein
MTTSELEQPDLIASIRCTDRDLVVSLKDGRRVSAPLWWYPRLLQATRVQRGRFEIGRFGIHWPEIDEDIELAGLLVGAKAPDARRPRSNRIDPRILAHADLWSAIQSHEGRPMPARYDQALMTQYEGRVIANADRYLGLIELAAEFGTPVAVAAFLISARSVIVKWLDVRKDRTLTIQHRDTHVTIKGAIDVDKALAVFRELETRKTTHI